ncbi:hypothetical protein [Nocardioides sp.]|uniref:hypothetical protein n=1 Tax=Nocardioides sp. TaxID=35761 RepID=UPI0035B3E4CE
MNTVHAGPLGNAVELDVATSPVNDDHTTIAWWLLTGFWHPLWQQFSLTVVTLEEREGVAPAKLHFPGATHELAVIALNPGEPPRHITPEAFHQGGFGAAGGYLQPIDVCHQSTATDDEMIRVADRAAWACVNGILTASTDDARDVLRMHWLGAIVKTLAHLRGEAHAS